MDKVILGVVAGLFILALVARLGIEFWLIFLDIQTWYQRRKKRKQKPVVDSFDNQRESMFNAWKEKHDRGVKKCVCEVLNPRPTDKNNCWDCNGEIYKDYFDKVRWKQS